MDLDDDLKFAFDCEVNNSLRKTDAIRSALLQLAALRSKIPLDIFLERQRDLLQEYSFEVDKEDGTNSFINSTLKFLKESQRPCMIDKWQSVMKKRLDENMDPVVLMSTLNSNVGKIVGYSKIFRENYKKRIINFNTKMAGKCEDNLMTDDEEEKSTPSEANISNKIVKIIQNNTKQTCSPKLESKVRNSPTRVSGLFKSGSRSSKSLFSNSESDSNSETYSQSSQKFVETNKLEANPTVKVSNTVNQNRKKSFMTGLEKHLADQVLNNNMDTDKAKQILEEVRNDSSTFKNPSKKSKQLDSVDETNQELIKDERLKGIESSMIELIQSEIVSNLEKTDWTHIAGLENAKSKIQQIAILPLLRPDLFTGIRSPPKGILLFGPPGTGKTMIGRCIASQANATFFSITSSTLTSKWIGDGEKSMKTMFSVARCLKPSVIFIDEVDSLLKTRSDSEHESSRRMKTEFLAQFDGLSNQSNDGLLVIGTTNRPQELDEAVRRRFAAKLYIGLPGKSARELIIKNNLKNEKHSLNDEQIASISEKTDGYSGSDMKHLCSEAAMYSFKEVMERLTELDKNDIREINFNDFILALNTVKPSFSIEDLKQYETWNSKFGSD